MEPQADLSRVLSVKAEFTSERKTTITEPQPVILPFLTAVKSRGYAAINGGLPPLALCGRS